MLAATDLPKHDQAIPRSLAWEGDSPDFIEFAGEQIPAELFCKFMAWYLAEGSTTHRKDCDSYAISVAQETHAQLMFDVLSALPFKAHKTSRGTCFYDNAFGQALATLGKCNEKYIPQSTKNLSPRLLRVFLDAYVITDGNTKKNKPFGDYPSNEQRSFSTT